MQTLARTAPSSSLVHVRPRVAAPVLNTVATDPTEDAAEEAEEVEVEEVEVEAEEVEAEAEEEECATERSGTVRGLLALLFS